MSEEFIALVPARGGSQGVPRKNVQAVGERSLLVRAIHSAKDAASISSCVVSSDDEEILRIAALAGAHAHRRSREAATDSARASQVVFDYLKSFRDITDDVVLVYLQPTSPFRTAHHVDRAIEQFRSGHSDSLVSVMMADQYMEKALQIGNQGFLGPAFGVSDPGKNRQELAERVYPNGAIYIFTVGAFRRIGEIPVRGSLPFMMGKVESLDVDDSEDLMIARAVADSAGI